MIRKLHHNAYRAATRRRRAASTRTSSACRWCTRSRSAAPRPAARRARCTPSTASTTARTWPSSRPPDLPFEFKAQHDFDLHIALEVGAEALQPMLAKGRAQGIECRGPSDHGMIDSIYFRDPNGYVIELCAKRADHDAQMDPASNDARATLQRWCRAKSDQGARMIVERIWTGNAYRNYNYLIACPESGEALAIDPLDHEKCLNAARVKGWQITQILNTHEHHDHTGGNAAVVAATGAKVIAHHRAGARIAGVDRGVKAGDVIKVGRTVELECMDTPGHTMCHICLRSHTEQPALFSGDTLFNAGAGNCHNGGNAGGPVRHLRRAAREAARRHPRLPGPRLHREQPALHPGARARQRRREGAAARGGGPGSGDRPGDDAGRGEEDQHLPAPAAARA